MNNSEINILMQLVNKMQTIADDILEIKLDVKSIEKRVRNVENRLTGVELNIENNVSKSIKILAEGHSGMADKIGNMHDDVEEIKSAVSILDFIQKQMGKKL